ncbi:MAG: FAD-dependent oxidoreductase [Rhizobiaceae bacterium]
MKIGPVRAKNRFYAVPHATGHGHLQPNGSLGLRKMKAEGGWGVVSMQITEISADSDFANHPMERLWDDGDIEAHTRNVEAIKSFGALAAIELAHGGARSRNMTTGAPVLGPSALPVLRPEVPVQSRAMDLSDIRSFRKSHRLAARRAKQAGYDILYVYAAHDLSLLSHFLSRRTNHRTDEYGGNLENRVRLLREVLEDTLDAACGDCAVALRFSVEEMGVALPLTHDGEGRDVVEMLAQLPDLWDVNLSGWSADSATSRFSEEGFQTDFTSFVKTVTDKPVVGVGRFTSPDTMASLVRTGKLDLIGAARPSIADPFLPQKIQDGRTDEIRECIGCNICVASDAYGIPLRCTQNPTIAEEWRRGWHPEHVSKSPSPRKALVIGAGPAGLECSLSLAKMGHHVTLADSRDHVGGRVALESSLPGLATWRRVADYRVYQLQQLDSVNIYLSSTMTAKDAAGLGADIVVVATGSEWRRDGVGSTRFAKYVWPKELSLLTPDDIMAGQLPQQGPVVVYDDEHFYMGGLIAELLRDEGYDVSLATPHTMISAWTDYTLEKGKIHGKLHEKGVRCRPNYQLQSIDNGAAHFLCPVTGDSLERLPCDTLVMVGARSPNDTLFGEIDAMSEANATFRIGDCVAPGTIQAAVYSGHRIARSINDEESCGPDFKRERALFDG